MRVDKVPSASVRRPMQHFLDEDKVAAHQRLGLPTIRARIRQAISRDLNLHLR